MDYKLKPCPFCGGEAEYCKGDWIGKEYWVKCTKCSCKTSLSNNYKKPIEEWNTRKPIDRIVEQLENELELAEKQKEECTFKALPYYDRTEGYIVAMSNAINIVKGDDENE